MDITKAGYVYNVTGVAPYHTVTQFGISFHLGDWAIYNSSGMIEKSDNSDDVTSVNGQTGTVIISLTDLGGLAARTPITGGTHTKISYGADGLVTGGRIQGFLDTCGVPYTGCGVLASALTMDKALTKLCAADTGLVVAPSITLFSTDYHADPEGVHKAIEKQFEYPFFIKPAHLGSSVGISKVHCFEQLPDALESACALDSKVLVEKAITGREIEVAVLGNELPTVSICGEIEPGGDFYDYQDKYIRNTAKLFIPARIPGELQQEVQSAALKVYKALGCKGMSRIDFFVDEQTGTVVLNEVNTIPGFTDISMFPRLMEATDISFPELADRLLQLALEKNQPCNIADTRS